MNAIEPLDSEYTERQREVLDAVLALMVEEGDAFSTAKVARAAACSKETLYKWFGDRDGLLTATVRWQASKVRMPEMPKAGLTRAALHAGLTEFARSWLTVITGDLSIALNRAAVAHAGSGKSRLGEIVLTNGPYAMARRLEPLFAAGRRDGLLDFEAMEDAFRAFFGLVVGDTQIRVLLGESQRLGDAEIGRRAQAAAERFLVLFGKDGAERKLPAA